jgi:hypothetical protein
MDRRTGLLSLFKIAFVIGIDVGRPRKTSVVERFPKRDKIVLLKADGTIGQQRRPRLEWELELKPRSLQTVQKLPLNYLDRSIRPRSIG